MAQQVAVKQLPQSLHGLTPAGSYTIDEMYRLAQACHASGLFEDTRDAAQAFMKILKGQELGLPVVTAMTAFDVIQKRLFIKPWVIAAKINSCGYGGYVVQEQTRAICTIQFMRRYPGRGWVDLPPVSYTIEEAQAHGLTSRSAHWKNSPDHMLYMRAMGRGGQRYFPELLAGLTPPPEPPPSPEQARRTISDVWGEPPEVWNRDRRTGRPVETVTLPEQGVVEKEEEEHSRKSPLVIDDQVIDPATGEPLPDDGWRSALVGLLGDLADPLYTRCVQALQAHTAPGEGRHLLAQAEAAVAQAETQEELI